MSLLDEIDCSLAGQVLAEYDQIHSKTKPNCVSPIYSVPPGACRAIRLCVFASHSNADLDKPLESMSVIEHNNMYSTILGYRGILRCNSTRLPIASTLSSKHNMKLQEKAHETCELALAVRVCWIMNYL